MPPTFGQVTAVQATAATITNARAGWVLAVEQPVYVVDGPPEYFFSQKRLLLVSPTGDRYKPSTCPPAGRTTCWA